MRGPSLLATFEQIAPAHQRNERANGGFGNAGRLQFGRRPPDRQIMQQRQQISIVQDHCGPCARRHERDGTRLGACERVSRQEERTFGWRWRRRSGRRPQRDARDEPSSAAAEAALQQARTIQAKQQRRTARGGVAPGTGRGRALMQLALGAAFVRQVFAHQVFDQLEISGLDSQLVGRRAQQCAAIVWLDLDTGREHEAPGNGVGKHRAGRHGRPAKAPAACKTPAACSSRAAN